MRPCDAVHPCSEKAYDDTIEGIRSEISEGMPWAGVIGTTRIDDTSEGRGGGGPNSGAVAVQPMMPSSKTTAFSAYQSFIFPLPNVKLRGAL